MLATCWIENAHAEVQSFCIKFLSWNSKQNTTSKSCKLRRFFFQYKTLVHFNPCTGHVHSHRTLGIHRDSLLCFCTAIDLSSATARRRWYHLQWNSGSQSIAHRTYSYQRRTKLLNHSKKRANTKVREFFATCRGVPKIGGVEYPMTPGLETRAAPSAYGRVTFYSRCSLGPRPHPHTGKRVWCTSSDFLGLMWQFWFLARQSDSRHVIFHVTAHKRATVLLHARSAYMTIISHDYFVSWKPKKSFEVHQTLFPTWGLRLGTRLFALRSLRPAETISPGFSSLQTFQRLCKTIVESHSVSFLYFNIVFLCHFRRL